MKLPTLLSFKLLYNKKIENRLNRCLMFLNEYFVLVLKCDALVVIVLPDEALQN